MVIANFLAGLGMGELGIILVIVLVIFGAGKLPKIAGDLGNGIRNFKKAVRTEEDTPTKEQICSSTDPKEGSI